MFYLEVKPASQTIAQSAPKAGVSSHIIIRDSLAVGFTYNQCYAFLHELGNTIVVGESLTPVDAARARQISETLESKSSQGGIPDDDIHFFVAIDCTRGICRLYNSITNARSYYIHQKPDHLIIATSVVELNTHGVPLALSEQSKPEYMAYRSIVPKRTHFPGIQRLLAGKHVTITISNGADSDERFWYLREKFIQPKHDKEGINEIGEIMQRQISRTLGHYKKPAILLSGGNDSSLLTAMCTKTHPAMQTYTTSFSAMDPEDKEIPYAKSVADHLGLPSISSSPTAEEYLRGLVEAIAQTGEPLDHLQTVLLHLLYKRVAADGCDLLVCGQMADTLFGDALFVMLAKYQPIVNALNTTKLNVPLRWLYNGLHMKHGRLKTMTYDFGDNIKSPHHILWTLYRYSDHHTIENLFAKGGSSTYEGRAEFMKPYLKFSLYDRITAINFLGQAGVPLGQWGRLAEENKICFYYPFLTPELVHYLFSLPWVHKMDWNRIESKHALRTLLRQYGFPENLITRPKQSFGFSIDHWALPGKLLQPIVDMAGTMYGAENLRSLQDGVPSRAMLLWTLLNLYLWEQLFTAKRSVDDLSGEILERRKKLIVQ